MDNNYYGNICYCRRCDGIVHTIKRGDSLYLLSRHYNVPIGEIMNANRNLNVYNLQIGQEICIPMRRSDMMNDGQATILPRNMMEDNRIDRDMANDNSMNRAMNDNNMMNNTMGDTPTSNRDMMSRDMEPEPTEFSATSFDTSIRMSELLQREDMTFEAFRDLMAEYLK